MFNKTAGCSHIRFLYIHIFEKNMHNLRHFTFNLQKRNLHIYFVHQRVSKKVKLLHRNLEINLKKKLT